MEMNAASPPTKEGELLIALAGHPNVGKSTVFNSLTGLRQHTGNWAGKTVVNAFGRFEHNGRSYLLADLPGCCTITASTAEERAARDFILTAHPDLTVVCCSADCLERGVSLAIQVLEITRRVVVCVNLLDEAARKGIVPDLSLLEKRLCIPVVGTSARSGEGLDELVRRMEECAAKEKDDAPSEPLISYPAAVQAALARILPDAERVCPQDISPRWLALRMIDQAEDTSEMTDALLGCSPFERDILLRRARECAQTLAAQGFDEEALSDVFSRSLAKAAAAVCRDVVPPSDVGYSRLDRRLDRILTGRITGLPIMLALLTLTLWITLVGANKPSELLFELFGRLEEMLASLLEGVLPPFWFGLLITGAFRVLGWVVSVMLPPMAIFFPLFTLLEDAGYLPRVAFNLDSALRRCGACGKQALTMCMGLGCNAAGITGCRIISSPRERMVAILTNNFIPCNGRLPIIVLMTGVFLAAPFAGSARSTLSALLMILFVSLGVAASFLASRLLTATLLSGTPSSFSLELPHYRRPQIGRVIVRSLLDRTLHILARAVAVALPAGAVIWLLANLEAEGISLLSHMTAFFEPVGRIMGLDGVILTSFILGFPANELVLPIAAMAYSAQGELVSADNTAALGSLFASVGWDWRTAVSLLIFTLMHWPCSTSCITIFKETRSLKWTLAAIALPTLFGFVLCVLFSLISGLFC